MSENATAIDGLFSSDEFNSLFFEWQRARAIAIGHNSQLAEHIRNGYQDSSMGQEEIGDRVSWFLDMEDEEFEDYADEEAIRIRDLRTQAEDEERTAKLSVIDLGNAEGISQFAAYGLRLHMDESGVIAKSDLKSKIISAENDFNLIDKVIRDNANNMVTLIQIHATSGILGEGGIKLDDKQNVVFPLANGSTAYSMAFTHDMPDVYPSKSLSFGANFVHSILGSGKTTIFESWSSLLNLSRWGVTPRLTIALGRVAEGPIYLSEKSEPEYYERIIGRLRQIGNAAVASRARSNNPTLRVLSSQYAINPNRSSFSDMHIWGDSPRF